MDPSAVTVVGGFRLIPVPERGSFEKYQSGDQFILTV